MSPSFAQLGVPPSICAALAAGGIDDPFEIQAATLPDALAGRDVCGRAPTGSGKTLAFGIPLVAAAERAAPGRPTSLVLAPTRELAEQITTQVRTFAGPVRVAAVYGGVGYGPQLKALRRGVEILVACPGRLEDLLGQGHLTLGDVRRVVLDEADRMADMGFVPAVRRILDQTSPRRQTLLWSATLDGAVAQLTHDYQTDPVRHEVGATTPDVTIARHLFWQVERPDRTGRTAEVVDAAWPSIVFCRTRHGSDRLARQLGKAGIRAAAIHGGRSQRQRSRALAEFADGRVHALVATDVAARGIHVDDVASVVHYDPPEDHKTYLHRSGRTARAGRSGVVVSLVQPDQEKGSRSLQRRVGLDEGFDEPDAAGLRHPSGRPTTTPGPSGRQLAEPTGGEDGTPSGHRKGKPPGGEDGTPSGRRNGKPSGPKKGTGPKKGKPAGPKNGKGRNNGTPSPRKNGKPAGRRHGAASGQKRSGGTSNGRGGHRRSRGRHRSGKGSAPSARG